MDETFKTLLKYGPFQLAIAMIMVGVAINLEPLTIIGSVLLAIMLVFLVFDIKNRKKRAEH